MTAQPSQRYLNWYGEETTRLAELKRRAVPDIKQMLSGALETSFLCPTCLFGDAPEGIRYARTTLAGFFLPQVVDLGGGAIQITKSLQTCEREGYGPRVLFVWYKPEWNCHYCVGCGNLFPLPESLGMHEPWRGNER